MQLVISDVLDADRLRALRARIEALPFEDGRATAGWAAREVKRNLQAAGDHPAVREILGEVERTLRAHPLFVMAARPRRFVSLLLSRSEPGMGYGRHVDDALMRGGRTDLSFTLFLSDPESYEGGELVLETSLGEQAIKLPAGSLFLYPSTTLHRVETVRRGIRLAVVGWVRSYVRGQLEREILFDLDTARRLEFERHGKTETFDLLSRSLSNLLRLWAED